MKNTSEYYKFSVGKYYLLDDKYKLIIIENP
jgi:hypothetical protein